MENNAAIISRRAKMDVHQQKVKNLVKNRKDQRKKIEKLKSDNKVSTKPIKDVQLSIRDFKNEDKYHMIRIISDFRRDFYINVYKSVFRCWFTYAITGLILSLSLTIFSSKMFGMCLPPLLVTIYLMWRVNRYKKSSRNYNINEMELLNQTETIYYKFKSDESRRINQGVIVAFLKEQKSIEEIDIEDIDISDFDSDLSDFENKINEKNKKLVAYLVYGKQKDELETVCIKEICVNRDYRRRKIAHYFVKKVSMNIFRPLGYRRVTFQVSTFNSEAKLACSKYDLLFIKIYTWSAFKFVPGVNDERTVFAFSINDLKKYD